MCQTEKMSWLLFVGGLAAFPLFWSLSSADASWLVQGLRLISLLALAIGAIGLLRPAREAPIELDNELVEAYESGKHRRYTLFFAVNGGAFAVVQLLVEHGVVGTRTLTVRQIAGGMILFTAIMCFDILAFGLRMRRQSLLCHQQTSRWDGLFALPGWIVLGSLWLLISIGWFLAGISKVPPGCGAGREEQRETEVVRPPVGAAPPLAWPEPGAYHG